MRLTCIVAFNPLPDSRILASRSLTGSPTTPQAGQGQGLKQRYLSSLGAAANPAPSRSSEPLGLAKSVSPCLCPTAPLSLPLLIHFSPSLGLQPPLPLSIPAVTGGTTLALGQSREPDLPLALGDGCTKSRLSVALAWRRALGFHLPDRQLRLQRRSNLTEAESLQLWALPPVRTLPAWAPHPTHPRTIHFCVPRFYHIPGRLGAARRPSSQHASWAAAAFLGVCCRLTL